jgi:hypothetical protein
LQDHFSLKVNDPFLITQHGGSGACGRMAEKFPPLSPHVIFISREFLPLSIFSKNSSPAISKG